LGLLGEVRVILIPCALSESTEQLLGQIRHGCWRCELAAQRFEFADSGVDSLNYLLWINSVR